MKYLLLIIFILLAGCDPYITGVTESIEIEESATNNCIEYTRGDTLYAECAIEFGDWE